MTKSQYNTSQNCAPEVQGTDIPSGSGRSSHLKRRPQRDEDEAQALEEGAGDSRRAQLHCFPSALPQQPGLSSNRILAIHPV